MPRRNKARALGNSSGQWPKPLGHNWKGASPGALTERGCQGQIDGSRKDDKKRLANPSTGAALAARVALMRIGCDVESLGLPGNRHACVCGLRS